LELHPGWVYVKYRPGRLYDKTVIADSIHDSIHGQNRAMFTPLG